MRRVAALAAVGAALLVPARAAAHVTSDPAFVASGSTARLILSAPNERSTPMTELVVEPGPGVAFLSATSADEWRGSVEKGTARWTGGSLAPDAIVMLELEVRAEGAPGFTTLRAVQRYADGGDVTWSVPLTIVPPGAAEEDASEPTSHLDRAIVAAAAGLVAVIAWLVWAHRRRRHSLQDR